MAKPKKVKKAEDLMNISRNQAVMDAGDLADAIAAMRGKSEPAPEPVAEQAAPVSAPTTPARDQLVPEGETPLNDEQKAFFNAVLLGQEPPQQQVITPQTGYANQPEIGLPRNAPTQYDFRPVEPDPREPPRPRTPTQPKPQTYKVTADDATLGEIVIVRTKIEAYMRIKPELARQVPMPVRGSSLEDHKMALAQCRSMLSSGNEEVWLQWGLEYGSQMLEGLLPFVRERVPDAVALQLNADGFSADVHKALSGDNQAAHACQLRQAMQLCAVDLIGLISVSPWAMLGMGMLQMFTHKVHENNERMRQQYMAQASRNGVPLEGDYSGL